MNFDQDPAPSADSQAADITSSSLPGDTTAIQPRNSPAPWFYWGAIFVSALSIILTLALVVAGFSFGFLNNGSQIAPWCTYDSKFVSTGVGLGIFGITGFALLVLSILSARLALGGAKEERMGAIICLVIGIIGLPLFGVCWLFGLMMCAG